jgi:hypothetical protein
MTGKIQRIDANWMHKDAKKDTRGTLSIPFSNLHERGHKEGCYKLVL